MYIAFPFGHVCLPFIRNLYDTQLFDEQMIQAQTFLILYIFYPNFNSKEKRRMAPKKLTPTAKDINEWEENIFKIHLLHSEIYINYSMAHEMKEKHKCSALNLYWIDIELKLTVRISTLSFSLTTLLLHAALCKRTNDKWFFSRVRIYVRSICIRCQFRAMENSEEKV